MAVFSDRMVPERMQVFWDALQRGEFITDASGTYWVKVAGGWPLRVVSALGEAGI